MHAALTLEKLLIKSATAAIVSLLMLATYASFAWADEGSDAAAVAAESTASLEASAAEGQAESPEDSSAESETASETQIATAEEATASINTGNWVDPTQRADNSFIYDTSIEALFDQASLYENRTVQIAGEAIGDHINDTRVPGYGWVQLSSTDDADASSISVYISDDQARQIDRYGRYGVTGTILQVRGVYHQACDEHDGLADIHATNSAVIAKGSEHPDVFDLNDFIPGAVALLIGFILMASFYFARERMR